MKLTAEQAAARRTGIGASEAAAAIGLSRWKTPLELFLEKTTDTAANEDDALQLEMGQVLEPMVIGRFERKQKLTVTDRQRKFVDQEHPWRWATVDGIASDNGLVEAKSVGMADPREWGDEFEDSAVPMQYLIQAHHGLACTKLEFAWMPVVVLNRQFRIYRIRRDAELIELITAKELEFMACLSAGTPPAPITLDDTRLLWPFHSDGKCVQADLKLAERVAVFKAGKEKSKELKALQDALQLEIQQRIGDGAELVYAGKTIATWKRAKPSQKFDEDGFAIAQPELYRQFLKEVPGSRRLLIK